jgi:hypothetical protein
MRVHRPLGMIRSIFDTLHNRGFERLIAVGKFLNTLVGSVFSRRKALRASGLPSAGRSNLTRIFSYFVESRFVGAQSVYHDFSPRINDRMAVACPNAWMRAW